MVFSRISRIWKPEVFHGIKDGHFEGWYYKLVDGAQRNIWAIIPGIAIDNHGGFEAFIQVYNGITGKTHYFRYELKDFRVASDEFEIKIGSNRFSDSGISLAIHQEGHEIKGDLDFGTLKPWPITRIIPGAMGPFAFLPRMECSHAVLSFDHEITGSLKFDGKEFNFTGGRGFIGKEWGRSHPSSWIWIQSNHFPVKETSLSVSIATVPYLRWFFPGFIIGFLHEGQIYRFTNYNRAKITDLAINEDIVSMKVERKKWILEITAFQSGGTKLRSPSNGQMVEYVTESLTSSVKVNFYKMKNKTKELIFSETGTSTGLEIKGDITELYSLGK
jgi:hypothetical protein